MTAHGIPGDVYVYGQGENITMRDWADMILRVGEEEGYWTGREVVTVAERFRPGVSEVMALRVGYEKLEQETGWKPKVSWEEGVSRTIAWYAANRDRWIGRVDWLRARAAARAAMNVLVTGGGGFLGSHLVERLRADGHDPFVARKADYDLTAPDDAERLFADAEPAARLPSRRRGRRNRREQRQPRAYWYANMMMGANVLEQCAPARSGQAGRRRHDLRVPEVHAACPSARTTSGTAIPEETNAPYGIAKRSLLVGGAGLPRAVRPQRVYLLPVNLYGPRDNFDLETSHVIPALIRKMLEAQDEVVLWGDGTPTREFLYVEDCAEGIWAAAQRYDGAEPVNLGTGTRSRFATWPSWSRDVTGFEGEIVWDPSKPNGQPRRTSTSPAPRSASASARRRRCARASSGPSAGTGTPS